MINCCATPDGQQMNAVLVGVIPAHQYHGVWVPAVEYT